MTNIIVASIVAMLSMVYIISTTIHIKHFPISISSMAYAWEHDDSDPSGTLSVSNVIWILYIWICDMMTGPFLVEMMPDNWKFLAIMTMASLAFLGCMPLLYKDDHNVWHWVFGIASCVISQICILIAMPVVLYAWLLMPVIYLLYKTLPDRICRLVIPDITMYVELICGIVVLLGMALQNAF